MAPQAVEKNTIAPPVSSFEQKEEPMVVKANRPLGQQRKGTGLSIHGFLNKKEKEETKDEVVTTTENLPKNHFTETDLQESWKIFLRELKMRNIVIYNAVLGFRILKIDENLVRVMYPSDSAKTEFDKVSGEFFNRFKRKVNNFAFEIEYKTDRINLKKEIVTKRTIFEKMAEKNPVLKELDEFMKFDLS